ncbi:helicase HerA domain-containing protein [Salisaeta longa]|uniref:helicase HerA domain-containing protein n=1 Tax=Salisaeta longa TaxID=503170 RepID=UPI0003FB923D|nr:DUF87 domain-containing protein [Salisaeta longa]
MPDSPAPTPRPQTLGVITHGSLNGGLEMKLDASTGVESVIAGTFVVIKGEQYAFFSMITDVEIEAANEQILINPPGATDDLLRDVLRGTGTYATVAIKPMLMLPNDTALDLTEEEPQSVKTIPAHFAPVALATEDDVARVFGHEANAGGDTYFHIGQPIGMDDIPVCIHLPKFVERSNAVFGKTGTGKTFLTRLLLAGTLQTDRAVNLIFDMHSEYGFGDRAEGDETFVKGLRALFPHKVSIFTLDPETTRERGQQADHEVHLHADQIEPSDILPLRDTLNLNATAAESAHLLRNRYNTDWLRTLLSARGEDFEAMAEETGAHQGSLEALQRKLAPFEQYDFFRTDPSPANYDVLDALLENLDDGTSVVLEFGRYDDLRVYLLVANAITRRIRTAYEEKTNVYRRTKQEADKPRPLMITIEEAHKFLAPGIAHETPFGKIAREMRKFFVSLLVVDQRPSAIDEEVLSQIGTKLVAKLSDEKDMGAALVGTSDASSLRQVLASLDAKQQALVLGHAVPMPIVVKSRTYGTDFYEALRLHRQQYLTGGANGAGGAAPDPDAEMQDLF